MTMNQSESLRQLGCRLALGGLAGLAWHAGGIREPAFGVASALAAMVPRPKSETGREHGILLVGAFAGWCLFGLMPPLTVGQPLRGPFGGPAWIFACGLALAGWRLAQLRRMLTPTKELEE